MKVISEEKGVYEVKLGYAEMEMIYGSLVDTLKKFPKNIFELAPARNRLSHMKTRFGHALAEYKKEHGGGYHPERYINKKDE